MTGIWTNDKGMMYMSFTIKDALELDCLRDCKLVAGAGGTGNPITCIDTMEIPDITLWLKKNELLITTGYSIKSDKKFLAHLIMSLHKAQAAGIMIKTKFIGTLPEECLVLAEQLKVPLIEMPDEKPFIELINALMRVIVDEQNMLLDYRNEIYKKFTDLELNGGGLDRVGEVLFSLLEKPITLFDDSMNQKLEFPAEGYFSHTLGEDVWDQLMKAVGKMPYNQEELCIRFDDHVVEIRKIYLKSRPCGYIFAEIETDQLEDRDRIVLAQAVTAFALEFSKLEVIYQHQNMMGSSFFLDIIMGNIKSEEEAILRSDYLNWPKLPVFIVVLDIYNFEKYIQKKTEEDVIQVKQRTCHYVQKVFWYYNVECLVIPKSDSFSCIIPVKYQSQVMLILEQIQTWSVQTMGFRLTAGISKDTDHYLGLKNAYEDARDAIKIGEILDRPVIFIKDVNFEHALIRGANREYIREYIEETVGKLQAYDRENQTELLKTLSELVHNMGIRTQTADALFLHRNTLAYRIKKIESITGYDLSRRDKLLELGIALRMAPFFRL